MCGGEWGGVFDECLHESKVEMSLRNVNVGVSWDVFDEYSRWGKGSCLKSTT